ncbi:hypothetical protein ACFFLM_19005 [Deinococcus oregonensis]|uniref:Uncharacterized protein n=1 Tax=Deinococcus oregonensis TaxID=1805970 RepID=A0ABV6B2S2_9DEIO
MVERTSAIFDFLFEVSRFGNPRTASSLFASEEAVAKAGIHEINIQTIVGRTAKDGFYKYNGVNVLSFIELVFSGGLLIWYVQVDLKGSTMSARSYIRSCYDGPPYEIFVDRIYDQSGNENDFLKIISGAVNSALESIRYAVEDRRFLAIHAKAKDEYPESFYGAPSQGELS